MFTHTGNQLAAVTTTIDTDPARVGEGYVWTTDPATGQTHGQIALTNGTGDANGTPANPAAGWSQARVDATFYALVCDLAGAPQELINTTTGVVEGHTAQTLYGKRTWSGRCTSPLLFAGQYEDAESGWAYNRFRYYNPTLGAYNAQDPLGLAPRLASAQGYVDHAAHWVDVLGLASCGHPRHGRPTPDTQGPLLPNGQFEIPVYEVSRTSQPEVAQTLDMAIQQGQPTLLQRTTDKSIIRQNRAEATRGWDYTKGSPDEFPYASSRQGGAGATVNGVSRSAQRRQGGSLSSFYRSNRVGDGDYFRVKLTD